MNNMKIQKTISLRIHRPFYPKEIETEIKTFKIALPTAKSDRFPIPMYKQIEKGKGGL
ncbi:MAG: hypothetical protein NUV74_07765 [Candidatus Brocadiaceae bacterium]|nr:hypothetical protein [Candidatus Brocadiaceae bacterium]